MASDRAAGSGRVDVTAASDLVVCLQPGVDVDVDTLGGKGKALAALVEKRFPIPRTAVVTTRAYEAAVGGCDVAAGIEGSTNEQIDRLFLELPVEHSLEQAVLSLARATGHGGRLAVRSSATVEDLGGSSFAGQYRSLLDVDADDDAAVMSAVRLVWASLWHRAPTSYRRAFGIDDEGVAMAVVMMEMVPATTAGVVFTADPGGSAGARIERVLGLGESLVSGDATPEAWVVPDQVPVAPEIPPDVREAVRLARLVAEAAGTPQDVEWAAADDEVFVLQARPITVLEDSDGFDSAVDGHELTTEGINEFVPGVLPPLAWDMNRFLLEHAYGSLLASFGDDSPSDLGAPIVRRVRGRVAVDLDQLRWASVDSGDIDAAYFGEQQSNPPQLRNGTVRSQLRRAGAQLRTVEVTRRETEQAEIVIRSVDLLCDQLPRPDLMSETDLLRYRRRLLDLAARGLAAELAVASAGAASFRQLDAAVSSWLDSERARPLVLAATADIGARKPIRVTASAAVFGGPTWSELGRRPREVRHSLPSPSSPTKVLLDTLRQLPGWRRRRILTGQVVDLRAVTVKRLIRTVTEQLRRREDTKAAVLQLGGEVRRVHDHIALRLVDRGLLEVTEDINFLGWAEVDLALECGEAPGPEIIRRRRAWTRRYETEAALPRRFVGMPDDYSTPLPEGDQLTGWAASPGRYRGVAFVVRQPDRELPSGSVIVAEATDASWSPLFLRAGAIVVERGGPLSHAAILARELGLPAVLNVESATAVLDGLAVTVDGTDGVVVIDRPDNNETEAS